MLTAFFRLKAMIVRARDATITSPRAIEAAVIPMNGRSTYAELNSIQLEEAAQKFMEFCGGNGIEHIVTSVRRPSTISKIEVFHKGYVCEASMFATHR